MQTSHVKVKLFRRFFFKNRFWFLQTNKLFKWTLVLGVYMYTESNGQVAKAKARLISPMIPYTGNDKCLKFYYNIFGKRFGELAIKDEGDRLLWKITEADLSKLHT